MKLRFNKIFSFVTAVMLATIISGATFGAALAQTSSNSSTKADGGNEVANCYTIKLSLLKDSKPTNEVKVKVSQIKKYSLEVKIITADSLADNIGNPSCRSGTYSLKYDIYNDASGTHTTPVNSGYFDQNSQVSDKSFTKTYPLTDPAKTTYTYSLIWKGGTREPMTASINVTYTDDKGNIDPAGTPVSNVNAKPSINVNTAVGVNYNGTFDQELGTFSNPLNAETLPELMATILRILFALIGIISVIIIIIAGFRMVLASGNEAELTKAKQAITWAIIGLIVALMSFSIVAIVQKLIQG